ncbi:MAG: NAD(P)-dependent oxidoreductase [Alphaproteobacteria bacterium]|nr:NAD(P)-dependent oxidoreductase [Alphaproteobacteria bacterium]MBT5390326.1 NAD(P)-dependent oxidoreductase [Alphaproteobacteria bacterium]
MITILITGSKGLIGSSISQLLETSGFRVVEYDNFYHKTHPGYGTLSNQELLSEKIKGCDGVIHLASVSRVIWGEQNPELCDKTNRIGTRNVIRAALTSSKKPWIIYASSREVYGEQEILPVQEDFSLKPMNIYAHSKVAAEKLITEVRREGLKTSILRFSNVFGGADDHVDRVIPAFSWGALNNQPLKIEGRENVFDFTHVEDVARGIFLVVAHLVQEESSLPPIHFTSGQGKTLGEAANIIIGKARSKSRLLELPPRNFDVSRFYGDPSRSKELLGWKTHYNFEQAIDKYLVLLRTQIEERRKIA